MKACSRRFLLLLCLGSLLSFGSLAAKAAETTKADTLSLQYLAMAPNAGGQIAYALRWAKQDRWELGVFSNSYLITGKYPLSGASLAWRFPLCKGLCAVRSFVELGAGMSTAGPLLEFIWSFAPLSIFRIDVTTHAYFSNPRPIIWSYPLWIGISLPFF